MFLLIIADFLIICFDSQDDLYSEVTFSTGLNVFSHVNINQPVKNLYLLAFSLNFLLLNVWKSKFAIFSTYRNRVDSWYLEYRGTGHFTL